jgi:hypothetical protein
MKKQITLLTLLFFTLCTQAIPWPIPDSGQTESFTDTFGEDSDYNINPRSYTKLDENGNDLPDSATSWAMVRDNVTCLIWEVKTDDRSIHDRDNQYNWNDAETDFIKTLNNQQFAGVSDWRMPTINELASIVDLGTYKPSIDTRFFPGTMSAFYWSSTSHAYLTASAWGVLYGSAWGVDFDDGGGDYNTKPTSYCVRAVRGGQCR